MSELLVAVGVAIAVAIALTVTIERMGNVWESKNASTSHVEAPQQVLILETGAISPGLEVRQ